DFRGKTRDSLGDDWPIGYGDLKPYYDLVERLEGIVASTERLPNHPDGVVLPPPEPRSYEKVVKAASDRLVTTRIPYRRSSITQPLNGRAPCHYCGQCNRGCATNSNFSSPGVLIEPALATGRLTLVTGAMAREVTVGPDGKATGVTYIDKATGEDRHAA